MLKYIVAIAVCIFWISSGAIAGSIPDDPLNSPVWKDIAIKQFGDAEVVFDERVKVLVPSVVENQAQVPVIADARELPNVDKIVVIADLNPIQHVLTYSPEHAKAVPYISFRMKVEQATPVRAAALTSDGVWHVGGVFLEAAGGGCSSPALARDDADWTETVGKAQGRAWRKADGTARMRLRVKHPMDTGLAKDNTPPFFIERLDVKDKSGDPLATLEMFEPVSEDPTITLDIKLPPSEGSFIIDGRDNNGNIYRSTIPVPFDGSALPSGWKDAGEKNREAQPAMRSRAS
ncbi:MAG: quinoprotein dehydrogenase-associated SoxYZ-like carrier [Hyphomicrobiaceae bacterium]